MMLSRAKERSWTAWWVWGLGTGSKNAAVTVLLYSYPINFLVLVRRHCTCAQGGRLALAQTLWQLEGPPCQ